MNKWPWTKTEVRLAKLKYCLVLLPGARIDREWIMRPSRSLKGAREAALHHDLDMNLIDVVYDPSIPSDPVPDSHSIQHQSAASYTHQQSVPTSRPSTSLVGLGTSDRSRKLGSLRQEQSSDKSEDSCINHQFSSDKSSADDDEDGDEDEDEEDSSADEDEEEV
jgi:hypothetical protein